MTGKKTFTQEGPMMAPKLPDLYFYLLEEYRLYFRLQPCNVATYAGDVTNA